MNLKQLLEETYNLKPIADEIIPKLWKDFKKHEEGGFDITKYFKPIIKQLNPKFKKAIALEFEPSMSPSGLVKVFKKVILLKLNIPVTYNKSKIRKELLNHELTHILDFIRMKKATPKQPKKYAETQAGYLRNPTEFNALVHEIKTTKKKKRYSNITSREDFIDFFKRYSAEFDLDASLAKLMKNDDFWYNKLLKRLAREKLLPKNFKP